VASDEGWVTMHGPKIEHKRRKGEENVAMACGGGKEQLDDDAEAPMACGGGRQQLTDAEAEALTAR
jgi:anaerobic magnesium-protoporphyrin IX monomethyl ester cyclase